MRKKTASSQPFRYLQQAAMPTYWAYCTVHTRGSTATKKNGSRKQEINSLAAVTSYLNLRV